jgi:hypothetical protein
MVRITFALAVELLSGTPRLLVSQAAAGISTSGLGCVCSIFWTLGLIRRATLAGRVTSGGSATVPDQDDDQCDNADQKGRGTDQGREYERGPAETILQTVEKGNVFRHAGQRLEDVVHYGEEKKAQHRCEEESPELP